MANDLMGYDQLAQDALRTVVRKSVERAAGPDGLPGAHHFYIMFRTTDPDCDIDASLRDSYPEEMTIVLEHQFWDLSTNDDGFEVTLKFGGVPKYLYVPWRAVTRFHDPSVDFRLHFKYEAPEPSSKSANAPETSGSDDKADGDATVVSLEAFRKKD
ncbi:ClpXP protease specificity-enhancing factor SspB [Maricaulaceae bacterium EIL42A08]|nr:ClpXP protease specificity-enhancing factor SspB [Maricaulaceae bacterium EIL42A08]MCP2680260.1 ClpXP protease specificity-enhancing factor SspB [Maricaulaceae bacterium NA33B04]